MTRIFFAAGALAAVAFAVPAAAQMADAASLPKCSATLHDSCDQGANNPKAMSAAQAEASGGVGDRTVASAAKPATHHKMKHKTTTTTTDTSTSTPS